MADLEPFLTRVQLVNSQVLHERGEAIEHVYFVQQGFVSTTAASDTESRGVEVGVIGAEGLVGAWVMLDRIDTVSFNQQMVQTPGSALRMSVSALRAAAGRLPAFNDACLRSVRNTILQVSQTAACNVRHSLPERCARWLLMAHDRTSGDELGLTQEFLAIMLGVRRGGVAEAAGALQQAGVIRYSRGTITVLDRAGLEAASCTCYRLVQDELARLAAPTASASQEIH